MGACLTVAALVATTAGGACADDLAGTTTGATSVADADTRYTYTDEGGTGVLGDELSTRYSGRVWTDKTVTTKNQTFEDPNGTEGQTTPVTVENDSDFLVTYSALATSTETVRQRPTDTVFVLDFSMTMGQTMDGGEIDADKDRIDETRMYVMLNALEDAMQDLAQANEKNRIGIVVFVGNLNDNSQAQRVLLPLTTVAELTASAPPANPVYTTPGGFFSITDMRQSWPYSQMGVQCNLPRGAELWTGNWTPTQAGLYDAMQILLNAAVDPKEHRQPNVVLMSDGATNEISVNGTDRTVWYEDVDTGDKGAKIMDNGAGANSSPFAAFATVLMGAYLDEQVEQHYSTDNTVYTIGVTGNSSNDQIRFALDPKPYLTEAIAPTTDPNHVVERSRDAIYQYLAGGTEPVTVQGVNTSASFAIAKDKQGATVPSDFYYVDTYYEAHEADDLENAFSDIAGDITSRARYPIDMTGGLNPDTGDGYITYEDPIGEYMQIKDIKTLLYMGEKVLNPTRIGPVTDGNGNQVTTYTFEREFQSPIDDQTYNTRDIKIQLVETPDRRQTLKVMIPAQAIPLRVNTLTLDDHDNVVENTNDGDLPLRLCYTVGLRHDIDPGTLEDGSRKQAVSDAYIQANMTDDGRGVYLYSNDFTRVSNDSPASAMTTVTFTPADDNPFYFIQKDTPLYLDENCTQKAENPLDSGGTYWFPISYYEDTNLVTDSISRSGALLAGYTTVHDGQLYIVKGAPRLGNLQDVTASKTSNATGTAANYREPTFEGNPETGRFVVYLGNNGRMTLNPTMDGKAHVDIDKTLTGRPWAADDEFAFIITPQGDAPLPDPGDDITIDDATGTATLVVRAPQEGDTGTGSFTVTIPSDTEIPDPEDGVRYVYQVTEQKGDAPSMDYDARTLTVTITVKPDGNDQDLRLDTSVEYEYSGDGDETGQNGFTNTFTPVSKLPLTGGDATARNLLLAGGGMLLLAGAAWLLARRRRV